MSRTTSPEPTAAAAIRYVRDGRSMSIQHAQALRRLLEGLVADAHEQTSCDGEQLCVRVPARYIEEIAAGLAS